MSLDLRIDLPANAAVTVTAHGTPVRLSDTELRVRTVVVQAKPANTDRVAIGGANINATTPNGLFLAAGQTHRLGPADLHDWYVDAKVDGEGVVYTGERV